MATVVHIPKDTRAAETGLGVGNFLNSLRDRRLDGLQQDLVKNINEAQDEATAAAFLADPKYQDLVGERYDNVITAFNNFKPGQQTQLAFDADGNQVAVSFDPRKETFEEFLQTRDDVFLNPPSTFYTTDPSDPESMPTAIPGVHRTFDAAKESLPEEEREMVDILNEKQAAIKLQAGQARTSRRLREDQAVINRELADYRMASPLTQFDAVVKAHDEGRLNDEQFEMAWARITTMLGRSPDDVRLSMKEELDVKAASVDTLSRVGHSLIEQVRADPGMLTSSRGLERLFNNLGAEIDELARFAAGDHALTMDLNDPKIEAAMDRLGFGAAERSDAFRNRIKNMTILVAAANGQTGRALSDKDLEFFGSITGGDLRSADSFELSMGQLINDSIDSHINLYERVVKKPWLLDNKPFQRYEFETDKRRLQAARTLNEQWKLPANDLLELPPDLANNIPAPGGDLEVK
jgi:hypothetical protein